MATRWRLVFDGDNLYTEKEARIYKLKDEIESSIDSIPGVVDSLDSTSTTDALSANMGKEIWDRVNELAGVGTFLSTWDATTWLPWTEPQDDPYLYKAWDYYIVSNVGATNYKPHWWTYVHWVPSTAVETWTISINDWYLYDGADWVRQPAWDRAISIDVALSTTSTNAVENRVVTSALNTKQSIIPDLSTIRSGAAAWATALQPGTNISNLTNNIWYQTAWDVNSAINSAITALDMNTKTFTISSLSDLTHAQEAYEWRDWWKEAIIIYEPERSLMNEWNSWEYRFLYSEGGAPVFVSTQLNDTNTIDWGWRSLYHKLLMFSVSGWTVTSMNLSHSVRLANYLSTTEENRPFYPANNYDPATKRYVDEAIEEATPSKEVPTSPQDFANFVQDLYTYYTQNWIPYPIIVKDGSMYVFSRVETEWTQETIVYLKTVVNNNSTLWGRKIDGINQYSLVYNNWVFDSEVTNRNWNFWGELINWLPCWSISSTDTPQEIDAKLSNVATFITYAWVGTAVGIMYEWNLYIKWHTYQTDWNYRKISFIRVFPNPVTYVDWTSRTVRPAFTIYFTFDSSTNTYTYDHYTTNTTYAESPYVLRTDYDYPTPYTPLYNGSPATKKYVDDNITMKAWLCPNPLYHQNEAIEAVQNVVDYRAQDGIGFLFSWGFYSVISQDSSSIIFQKIDNQYYNNGSTTTVACDRIIGTLSGWTVTSVTQTSAWFYVLDTNTDYNTAYTPQYDWSPATKKYVDDIVWNIETLLANI